MGDAKVLTRIFKDSGVYSIAVVVQRAMAFVLLPVYTRYLSAADYGLMELLDLTGQVASIIIGLRIGQALFYYYEASANDPRARKRYVSTAFVGALVLGLITGASGFIGAPYLSAFVFGTRQYTGLVKLFFAGFAFLLPIDVGFCYLRVTNRPKAFLQASLWRMAGSICLSILFLSVYHMGVAAVLWSSLVSAVATTIYMVWLILRHAGLGFEPKLFSHVARYSAPLCLSAAAWFVLHTGDRIFLRTAVSLTDLGIYAVAYKIGMVIAYVQMPFSLYWSSQMFNIVRGPSGDRVYVRLCTYIGLGLTFALVLLTLAARPFVTFGLGAAFQRASIYVPWIGLAYVIRALAEYFGSVFFLQKRTVLDAASTTASAFVCLVAYALLIPAYKLWGAVLATLLGFSALFVISLWQAQRIRPFRFETRRLFLIVLSAACPIACSVVVRPAFVWQQILQAILLALSFPILLFMLGFLSAGEREAIEMFIRRVRGSMAALVVR